MSTAAKERLDTEVVVLTGSMGAGKSTVLAEMSDVLTQHHIVHAAIDVDSLAIVNMPDAERLQLERQNLRCVCKNCLNAGITRFIVALAVETIEQLTFLQQILGPMDLRVCRLRAPTATMEKRVQAREVGMQQRFFCRTRCSLGSHPRCCRRCGITNVRSPT